MIKLWKKYCDRVDKHNEHVSYVNYEDYWCYGTIFYPFFQAALITFGVWACTSCTFKEGLFSYITSFIGMSLVYLIHWITTEKGW